MKFAQEADSKIIGWLKKDQLEPFGKYLLSGLVHGKPGIPVAELSRVEKIVAKNFSEPERFKMAKRLLVRPEYTARNIGTQLIVNGWPGNKDVEALIVKAAEDDDWIVREYAAGTMGSLLAKDFPHFSKLYLKWLKSGSVNIKRAIALAVKYESKAGDAAKWPVYFDLINPLMGEEAEYIRKNLGPFAIGDGLLSRFPEKVLKACKVWMKSPDQNVRWNTAMIFTAAAARKFPKEGKSILKVLEKDASAFVSRAAKKALRNLEARS